MGCSRVIKVSDTGFHCVETCSGGRGAGAGRAQGCLAVNELEMQDLPVSCRRGSGGWGKRPII